jgi:hypothetical protein
MGTMVNNGYSKTLEYQADKTAITIPPARATMRPACRTC